MVPIKSVHSGVLSRPLVSTPVVETFWRRLEQDPRHGARVGYPSEVTPRDTFVPSPVMPGCLLPCRGPQPVRVGANQLSHRQALEPTTWDGRLPVTCPRELPEYSPRRVRVVTKIDRLEGGVLERVFAGECPKGGLERGNDVAGATDLGWQLTAEGPCGYLADGSLYVTADVGGKVGSPDIKVGRSPGRSDEELCDLGRNRLIHGFFWDLPEQYFLASVDGRLRRPRSGWGACSAAAKSRRKVFNL